MAVFSGGTVTFGDLIINADRAAEAEPTEMTKTIHNQLMMVTGKYAGNPGWNADYDAVFGPYTPDYPHLGVISIEESPGGDHCPEIYLDQGYVLVGGACPVVNLPGTVRPRTSGTQFVASVTPGANPSDAEIYVIFIKQNNAENIDVEYPGAAVQLKQPGYYVKVTVTSGAVAAISQPAPVAGSGDQFAIDFYDWATKMASTANLRG